MQRDQAAGVMAAMHLQLTNSVITKIKSTHLLYFVASLGNQWSGYIQSSLETTGLSNIAFEV